MTPNEFGRRFGIEPKRLRHYLRGRWPHEHNAPWYLTEEMVADARRHFGLSRSAADVGLTRPSSSQGDPAPATSAARTEIKRSHGLEAELCVLTTAAGIPLVHATPMPWLTSHGHEHPLVKSRVPTHIVASLARIYQTLGGDASALAEDRPVRCLTPDLIHPPTGCLVEVDEVQHFTTARLRTFEHYPQGTALGFSLPEYRELIGRWAKAGDAAFRHKPAGNFPVTCGRQAQRAYYDAARDLLAPWFTGRPVIRIPVPDRSLAAGVSRLSAELAKLTGSAT